MSFVWGFGALVLLYIVAAVLLGTAQPVGQMIKGTDNRLSTSKFQILLWTAVVFFSYVVVIAARFGDKQYGALPAIPNNVLWAIGLSAGSMVAAKAVKVAQVQTLTAAGGTPLPSAGAPALADLVGSDGGQADIGKIQMLAWTVVAAVVFILRLVHVVQQGPGAEVTLPDIDSTLAILMGIGQGGYLGKKIAGP